MDTSPILVGIAGPSCSGKTSLARSLARDLPGSNCVLSLDAYYRDYGGLSDAARAGLNFDAPQAIDRELLVADLRSLARGGPVSPPVYDYATHRRCGRGARIMGYHVLVEGLFALHWPEIRSLYRLSLFVDLEDDAGLRRRLLRDTAERGRAGRAVVQQYRVHVAPMSRLYVLPTRRHADLVLSGAQPLAEAVARVAALLDASATVAPRSPRRPES